MARVVILGGGTGGAAAARSLAARLPNKHRLTLVEKDAELYFQPSFLQVMVGRRHPEDTLRSVSNLRAAGVEVIIDRVLEIDTERRRLRLVKETIPYDMLVLAAGAESVEPDPPELGDAGFNLYTPWGASSIYRAIENLERGEVVLLAVEAPFKCPCALYEAALILHTYFARRGRDRNIKITVHSPETKPVGMVGNRPAQAITEALANRGITLRLGQRLEMVDPGRRRLHFSGGDDASYELLIYIPRNHCPEVAKKSGLTDETGWVPADPFTLRTGSPGVYAIGDVNRVRLPSGEDHVKAGGIAHFQAWVVADNIAAQILDRQPKRLFGGKLGSVFETGDSSFAVFGNVYRPQPNTIVMPASRSWRAVRWFAEWQWFREHE